MTKRTMAITNSKQMFPSLVIDVGEGDVWVLINFVGVAGGVAFLEISGRVPGVMGKGTLVL